MRVSKPTHMGATGFWLLERQHGEQCDALATVPTEDVIERVTDDIVDCNGDPAIGVPPTKHCLEGHQRGVHRNLLPLLLEMRKTGATPAAILTELHIAWINGDLHDKITGKGDLPSQKQLKVRPLYRSARSTPGNICSVRLTSMYPFYRTSYIAGKLQVEI